MNATDDDMELIRGSGNVWRDFGDPEADVKQAKALLAAKIIGIMDDRKLSALEAAKLTGFSHTDFSRIRNAKLRPFTLDRLMNILGKLDQDVEISINVHPRKAVASPASM